jgi:hypothetical protein
MAVGKNGSEPSSASDSRERGLRGVLGYKCAAMAIFGGGYPFSASGRFAA